MYFKRHIKLGVWGYWRGKGDVVLYDLQACVAVLLHASSKS